MAVGRQSLTAGVFLGRAVVLSLLLLVPGAAGVWLFAVLFGAANSATTLARAALVAELCGSAHYGSISGVMTTLIGVLSILQKIGAIKEQMKVIFDLSDFEKLPSETAVGRSAA